MTLRSHSNYVLSCFHYKPFVVVFPHECGICQYGVFPYYLLHARDFIGCLSSLIPSFSDLQWDHDFSLCLCGLNSLGLLFTVVLPSTHAQHFLYTLLLLFVHGFMFLVLVRSLDMSFAGSFHSSFLHSHRVTILL
jgi:hypothetical protein